MTKWREKRQKSERAGRGAERLVALLYQLQGYRVLARRFRGRGGEIDIITRKGGLTAFVEVKMRKTRDAAILAVTPQNRRRLEAAGKQFLALKPAYSDDAVRYDIAAVTGWRVHLVKDAWRERI